MQLCWDLVTPGGTRSLCNEKWNYNEFDKPFLHTRRIGQMGSLSGYKLCICGILSDIFCVFFPGSIIVSSLTARWCYVPLSTLARRMFIYGFQSLSTEFVKLKWRLTVLKQNNINIFVQKHESEHYNSSLTAEYNTRDWFRTGPISPGTLNRKHRSDQRITMKICRKCGNIP